MAVPNHSPHALHSAIPLTQATKIVQHHISLKIIAKYDFVTNTPFINALPASDHRYNIQPKVNINGAVRQMLVAPRHRNKGGDVDFISVTLLRWLLEPIQQTTIIIALSAMRTVLAIR